MKGLRFFLIGLIICWIFPVTLISQSLGRHPVAGALRAEEVLMSQNYESRIRAFIIKIAHSQDFHITVDVRLTVFPRSNEEKMDMEDIEDISDLDQALPGFQFSYIKSISKLTLSEEHLPGRSSSDQVFMQAANSPVGIHKIQIRILLDHAIVTDAVVKTIERYISVLVPFRLSRGDELDIHGIDFSKISKIKERTDEPLPVDQDTALSSRQKYPSAWIYSLWVLVAILTIAVLFLLFSIKRLWIQTIDGFQKTEVPRSFAEKEVPIDQKIQKETTPRKKQIYFSDLKKIEIDKQAMLLQEESPRVVAVVLTFMPSFDAGEIFEKLSPNLREKTMWQLIDLQGISQGTLKKIESVIAEKVDRFLNADFVPGEGEGSLAKILSWSNKAVVKEMIDKIKERDKNMALDFSLRLFTFEKLTGLEDEIIKNLNRSISLEHLVIALEGASDLLTDKFYFNMTPAELKESKQIKKGLKNLSTKNILATRQEIMTKAIAILREKNMELTL